MREIRTSGLMSGEEKRSYWQSLNATALLLDSTRVCSSLPETGGLGWGASARVALCGAVFGEGFPTLSPVGLG